MAETKLQTQALIDTFLDGWIPVNEAWTYASATSVTVPSGAASRYEVGMKVKFTQTTVKYAVIASITDTTLTFIANNDYAVANAVMSNIFYAYGDAPVGFPASFAYTPIISAEGGAVTILQNSFRFTTRGRMLFLTRGSFAFSASTGTGHIEIALPISSADTEYQMYGSNTTDFMGLVVWFGTGVIRLRKYDGNSIAGLTNKYFKVNGCYLF